MKPQEWIKCVREAAEQLENLEFLQEGTTHLAAALEEIDRLQAQLSQAERVVPELTSGVSFWRHANGAWYCWNGWKNIEMTQSRVLKDGEVAVGETELAALREFADGWSEFRSQFDDIPYYHSGMGCGIEDRGITDRYAACEYGWDCAMERVAERFPEIDTLDALRSQKEGGAT